MAAKITRHRIKRSKRQRTTYYWGVAAREGFAVERLRSYGPVLKSKAQVKRRPHRIIYYRLGFRLPRMLDTDKLPNSYELVDCSLALRGLLDTDDRKAITFGEIDLASLL